MVGWLRTEYTKVFSRLTKMLSVVFIHNFPVTQPLIPPTKDIEHKIGGAYSTPYKNSCIVGHRVCQEYYLKMMSLSRSSPKLFMDNRFICSSQGVLRYWKCSYLKRELYEDDYLVIAVTLFSLLRECFKVLKHLVLSANCAPNVIHKYAIRGKAVLYSLHENQPTNNIKIVHRIQSKHEELQWW